MILPTRLMVRCCAMMGALLLLSSANLAATEPAVQRFVERHGFNSLDGLHESCVYSRTKLTRAEREELLALAIDPEIGERYGTTLFWIIFMTLRDSDTRADEAGALLQQFETIDQMNLPKDCRPFGVILTAFAFEQGEAGLKLEQAWFEKMRKEPRDSRLAYLFGVANTRWTHREEHSKNLRELYEDKETDEAVRKQIIAAMSTGAQQGGLPLELCVLYFRDLSALPVTTPQLRHEMFNQISMNVRVHAMLGEYLRKR